RAGAHHRRPLPAPAALAAGRAAGLGGGPDPVQPARLPGPVLLGAAVGRPGHRMGGGPAGLGAGRGRLVRAHPAGLRGRDRPPRRLRRPGPQRGPLGPALLVALLLLGEAIRGRRALDAAHRLLLAEQERSEGLLLNVLPAPTPDRPNGGAAPSGH